MSSMVWVGGLLLGESGGLCQRGSEECIRLAIELWCRRVEVVELELVLTAAPLLGDSSSSAPELRYCGTAEILPEVCWVEIALAPGAVPPGRYSVEIAVEGYDRHRSLGRLVVTEGRGPLPRPAGGPPGEPAGSGTTTDCSGANFATTSPDWRVRSGPMPRPAGERRVLQLRAAVAGGSEPLELPPDRPVTFGARLRLADLPLDVLLRLQVCSSTGEVLIQASMPRAALRPVPGEEACVSFELERLCLMPGRYSVAVGIWKYDAASEPIEAGPGGCEIVVGPWPAPRSQQRVWLSPVFEWLALVEAGPVRSPDGQGAGEASPGLLLVQGPERRRVGTGERLAVEVELRGGSRARLWFEDESGGEWAEVVTPLLVSTFPVRLRLRFAASMPGGRYWLCLCELAAVGGGAAKVTGTHRFPIEVSGETGLALGACWLPAEPEL